MATITLSNLKTNIELRTLWIAALLLVVANGMTWLPGWFAVIGVLVLGIGLPGVLCAGWLLQRALPSRLEFTAYSLGLGFTLYVVAMLVVTELPGPLHRWHVLVMLNLLCVALAIGYWRAQRAPAAFLDETSKRDGPYKRMDRWAVAGLVSVLLVAAFLRFPNLGYSDFLGDEARAMLYATDVIQGYPSALLVHKKGPTEVLIPLGIYAVEGQITEAQARLPFALAGVLGIFAIYLLGWRLFGAVAGWLAAMLLAVDGYFIGFARIVQYQSVVFCMTVLIALALLRQARANRPLPAYLLMAGLFLVAGVYSHYEAVWAFIPGLYLLFAYFWHTKGSGGDGAGLLRALLVPVLVTAGLITFFYVPFVTDSHWAETATYLFDHRIQSSFPHNGLLEFYERTLIYNSVYYLFFLIALTVVAQVATLQRAWPRWIAWGIGALTVAGLAITFLVRPDWIVIGGTDHTWIFFALATLLPIVPRHVSHEARLVWLWFGVAMVVSLFFIAKPNTHVYGFFMPWALVAGLGGKQLWRALRGGVGLRVARWLAIPASILLFALFANWTYWIFTYTDVEIFRTWTSNKPAGYWTPYEIPTRGDLFGLPYKNGWKVIGALYADGRLDAPFDSNESNRVADWYSRGPYFCPTGAEYYMLPTVQQPRELPNEQAKLFELESSGYRPWGVITVDGDERMRIFTKRPVIEAGDEAVRIFEANEYDQIFDSTLTSPIFVKRGPTMIVEPEHEVELRFGDGMWLKGYTLSHTQIKPGEQLELHLFWEATAPLRRGDKSSIQLIDLNTTHKAAQRDGEPGCGVYHLGEWREGDLNLDHYSLTVAPDTPPGIYTILISVYEQETHEHYPIIAPDGAFLGDSVGVATVEVVAR